MTYHTRTPALFCFSTYYYREQHSN